MIQLSVENLYGGGVVERIREELLRVITNIQDPNTPAEKARKVKMEITVKPNAQRNLADLTITTSSAICAPEPLKTSIQIGADPRTGEVGASEVGAGENGQHLLPDVQPKGKITHFHDHKSATAGM